MASSRGRATGRCARCAVRREHCICERIAEPIPTRARIVIIRHAREVWRPTNTARIVAEALAGAELLEYGVLDAPALDTAALLDRLPSPAWLLYPAAPEEEIERVPAGAPPPGALIAVDGSWSQTQRFVRRHPALYQLPRCALDETPSHDPRKSAEGAALRLRHARDRARRLTSEAIASYLAQWESPESGAALLRVHRAFVAATLAGRGNKVPDGWIEAP